MGTYLVLKSEIFFLLFIQLIGFSVAGLTVPFIYAISSHGTNVIIWPINLNMSDKKWLKRFSGNIYFLHIAF